MIMREQTDRTSTARRIKRLNYEPNTVEWDRGDLVIHDCDAKTKSMLMIVVGKEWNGMEDRWDYRTAYLYQEDNRKTGVWINDKKFLHAPSRFNIQCDEKDLREMMVSTLDKGRKKRN